MSVGAMFAQEMYRQELLEHLIDCLNARKDLYIALYMVKQLDQVKIMTTSEFEQSQAALDYADSYGFELAYDIHYINHVITMEN